MYDLVNNMDSIIIQRLYWLSQEICFLIWKLKNERLCLVGSTKWNKPFHRSLFLTGRGVRWVEACKRKGWGRPKFDKRIVSKFLIYLMHPSELDSEWKLGHCWKRNDSREYKRLIFYKANEVLNFLGIQNICKNITYFHSLILFLYVFEGQQCFHNLD